MLSKMLDNTMHKAMKLENLTKASRFKKQNYDEISEKQLEKEFLMLQKISEFVKKDNAEDTMTVDNEVTDFISEPLGKSSSIMDEIRVSTGLPFFKSIQYKLSEEFNIQ